MVEKEGKHFGKRATGIDAETDRMARLFLGKEDEEEARRRLKIVQVRSCVCTGIFFLIPFYDGSLFFSIISALCGNQIPLYISWQRFFITFFSVSGVLLFYLEGCT